MTGRNAHMNGMACITEGAIGFPGGCAVVPPENGTIAENAAGQRLQHVTAWANGI